MRGLSPVAASGGHSSSRCAGLSLLRPLLLRSTGSRRAGSVIVAHGPSCSAACGIFPDQGSNPRPLHWQADSQPLRHQGSPLGPLLTYLKQEPALWHPGRWSSRPCVNVLRDRALTPFPPARAMAQPAAGWKCGFWNFDPGLLVSLLCDGWFEQLSYPLHPPSFSRLNTLMVPHIT